MVPKTWISVYKRSNVRNARQDRTKITVENQQEVTYALSIGAKINDMYDPEGYYSILDVVIT